MERLCHYTTLLVVSLLFFGSSALDDGRSGRCPPLMKWNVCPSDAAPCDTNLDCADDNLCCESPCGGVCTAPLFTGCEHIQKAESRRARTLGSDGRSIRIPRCNKDGDFEPIQCDNEIIGSCWCVDESGFELPGTRAPARGLVNCTAPAACAAATCRMLCPLGFALGPDGCPQCRCRDPCQGVRCPGSLTCQLEEVACLRQPCPPVPTCKRGRSLDNICPVGDPLMISDTHRPFLCGTDPGKPTCPPLYQCLVQRGHDYGVCCPASLKIKKPGMCPSSRRNSTMAQECDVPCTHDLECPSMQKCCNSDECGMHCVFPENLTECLQQKSLAEALSINEREGRGYIPQCSENGGGFEQRQCSRNGLVCWCVDSQGIKAKGSMGPAKSVDCSKFALDKYRPEARSLSNNKLCDRNICASICEYGFRVDADGCPTCECDNPCQGFPCQEGEECVPVKEQTCQDEFCPTYPICRPKVSYLNPCMHETPLTNESTGEVINCDPDKDEDSNSDCPSTHRCVQVVSSTRAVCCPSEDIGEEEDETEDYSSKPGLCPFSINHLCKLNTTKSCVSDNECDGEMKCCLTSNCGSICATAEIKETVEDLDFDRSPSMCEYLRDFNEKMEGTHDGMRIALQTPECHENGSFTATQCTDGQCWCVDSFGTEVPKTKGNGKAAIDCVLLRETSECLELTCRLGCDYGFVISPETQCPLCECRNPCQDVKCGANQECQMVDVACDNDYCPPVPACLPKKVGSCPYLVPTEGSCEYQCQSDAQCAGDMRCCSNGCGTQCVDPIVKTACQHQKAIVLHKAAEAGIPGRQLYVPACKEDGSYESVQCHEANGICWCVDQAGRELPGTRTSLPNKPRCDAPMACPLIECHKECEHGYKLDSKGCSMCSCRDPCDEMKCLNEGEVCRVVEVQCITQPCPPVALCVEARVNDAHLDACGVTSNGVPPQQCGPNEPPCPSTHKCNLSPLTTSESNPAVCCPKPRSICFEPKEEGTCARYQGSSSSVPHNATTRWHFSPERNQCVQFRYEGCSGNHNNFQSENHCKTVCPVLSQCERLREKNQKAAIRYKKDTFIPKCRSDTGEWEPVQCMEHIGVCWCANTKGEPLKGSLVRGTEPQCNFRQARRRMDSTVTSTDEVLEELVRQMTAYNFIDSMEEMDTKPREGKSLKTSVKSRCLSTKERLAGSSAAYEVSCDSSGRYNPTQCESSAIDAKCWCVDEAGNQLPGTSTFTKGDNICLPTPIEAVDISLGFFGEYSTDVSNKMRSQLVRDLKNLGATLKDNEIEVLNEPGVTYIHFTVIGNNKVDISYHLEEMVKQEELALHKDLINERVTMVADIRKSTFHHKIGAKEIKNIADNKIIALQHREILSESTVSMVTSYHTAIIVLAAASAFVISTMSVVLMLYRKKVASMGKNDTNKVAAFSDRFHPSEPPVFVLSGPEMDGLKHVNERTEKEKL